MNSIYDTVILTLQSGGIILLLLLILLAWATWIIVLKIRELRTKAVINSDFVGSIEQLLFDKNLPEATELCRRETTPMNRIILAGILNYDRSENELKEVLEEAGRQEVPGIRRHLTSLGTIAGVSPLLGLLGTVLGMISVFSTLSQGNQISASDLAGGISQALVTTACGLVVAMPCLVFYNSLNVRAGNLIVEMEKVSLHMVAVLKRLR